MKCLRYLIAAAAFGFILPAQAAQTDPELIIYRFPGVFDNGGSSLSGSATVFHCSNFSGATENIRIVTRNVDTTIKNNTLFVGVDSLRTITAVTHAVSAYITQVSIATGLVDQGTTAIAATSTNIVCTAMTIDASAAVPTGLALRGIRFNPAPGSQE